MISVWLGVFFHEIADSIAQQRHVIIGQSRDDQFAHAARVGVHDFEKRRVIAWLHFAAFIFHEQMAGLRGAVKIKNRHAEYPRENFAMNDADKFIAAQNEFERGKLYPVLFAVKRETRAVNRVNIQKLRRPAGDLRRHVRQFRLSQKERNARKVHEQRVSKRSLLARRPNCWTSQTVARGRSNCGTPRVREFIENIGDESVQSKRTFFLCVPPAASKNDGQPFR